jgi:hypothetical protein
LLSQTHEHYNVPLDVSPFTSPLSRRQPPPELGADGIPAAECRAKLLIVSRDSRSSGKSSSRNSLSEMLPNDEQGLDTATNSSNFSKRALYSPKVLFLDRVSSVSSAESFSTFDFGISLIVSLMKLF